MSTTPNRLENGSDLFDSAGNVAEEANHAPEASAADNISDAEEAEFRRQKLAAIRSAIDAGAYDSDELLEHAMKKMRASIESGDDPQ